MIYGDAFGNELACIEQEGVAPLTRRELLALVREALPAIREAVGSATEPLPIAA